MKVSYNWLQNYFEEKLPTPEEISEGIIFHSFEVEDIEKSGDDTIFDIKVLPDRAHDCLSHWGIAKEISAIFDIKISSSNGFVKIINQEIKDLKQNNLPSDLKIKIEDDKCLRYIGRIVRNIKIGESPDWLKEKLKSIGQKTINNIVDAANFIMYDLGQPIHSFDLDKLESKSLIIRNGKNGEIITTLDKKEIKLDDSILVIADEKYPLAIAGIKGGTKAEVDFNTRNIVIEVANFNPTATRKTSKKINILTDAVKRYENEITPELCLSAMETMTALVCALSGGEVENTVDIYSKKMEDRVVKVTLNYINKRLGSNFSKEDIDKVWNKLNFIYHENNGEYEINIPSLRLDLTGPHDLTEEVIRIVGYDKLIEKLPIIKIEQNKNNIFYKTLSVRNKLLNDGYSEVMTYAFRDKGDIEVLASANGKNFLRNNLADGLRESVKLNTLNLPLLDMSEIKIFEIGTIFLVDREEIRVAYGNKKEIKEMSLDEFVASLDSSKEFSPNTFDQAQEEVTVKNSFKMWSLYPFISRDIAVWMPESEAKEKLFNLLKSEGTSLLVKDPYLFDSFSKEGSTSYAYRLVFQSYEKTLTDEEINPIMEKISAKISELGWQVR